MEVTFKATFLKDLQKIKDKSAQIMIKECIDKLIFSDNFSEIFDVKKLKSGTNAYRIKVNSYRIGFYYVNNEIELSRVLHRKDIYKYFPK